MTISAIQTSNIIQRVSDETTSVSSLGRPQDIEAFTQRLLAGGATSPEHKVVNQLKETQQSLMSGVRDASLVQHLSPESALTAQARLADSVIGVDLVAKVAGSFSSAVNRLVSMQ